MLPSTNKHLCEKMSIDPEFVELTASTSSKYFFYEMDNTLIGRLAPNLLLPIYLRIY